MKATRDTDPSQANKKRNYIGDKMMETCLLLTI